MVSFPPQPQPGLPRDPVLGTPHCRHPLGDRGGAGPSARAEARPVLLFVGDPFVPTAPRPVPGSVTSLYALQSLLVGGQGLTDTPERKRRAGPGAGCGLRGRGGSTDAGEGAGRTGWLGAWLTLGSLAGGALLPPRQCQALLTRHVGCGSQPRRVRCPWAPPLPSSGVDIRALSTAARPPESRRPLPHAHCALLGPMAGAEPQTEKRNRVLSSGALARKQGPGLQVSSQGPRCGQDAGWALPLRVHPGGQAGQRGTCPDSSLKWEDTSHEDGLCGRTRGGEAGNGVQGVPCPRAARGPFRRCQLVLTLSSIQADPPGEVPAVWAKGVLLQSRGTPKAGAPRPTHPCLWPRAHHPELHRQPEGTCSSRPETVTLRSPSGRAPAEAVPRPWAPWGWAAPLSCSRSLALPSSRRNRRINVLQNFCANHRHNHFLSRGG